MEVRWSPPAAEDLERIFNHIELDNPEAARRVVKTIYDGCATLKNSHSVAGLGAFLVGASLSSRPCPILPFTASPSTLWRSPASITERRTGLT